MQKHVILFCTATKFNYQFNIFIFTYTKDTLI